MSIAVRKITGNIRIAVWMIFTVTVAFCAPVAVLASEEMQEESGFLVQVETDGQVVRLPEGTVEISKEDGLYFAHDLKEVYEIDRNNNIIQFSEDCLVELQEGKIEYNDTDFSKQWYLSQTEADKYHIGLDQLWLKNIQGQDLDKKIDMDMDGDSGNDEIVIAVIDSGLKSGLTDLDYTRVIPGKNMLAADSGSSNTEDADNTEDTVGHGSFVTNMFLARQNNALGISGMLSKVYVMPIRCFSQKNGTMGIVLNGIQYAIEQKELYLESKGTRGANICVINMSIGGTSLSDQLRNDLLTVLNRAQELGIICVCAAGNKDSANPDIKVSTYPAQFTMGVGAVNGSGQRASFSRILCSDNGDGYQNKVWVCAPGVNIYSTLLTDDVIAKQGTSFSCPMVAALAAICKSVDNSLTQEEFKELLRDTSERVVSTSGTITVPNIENAANEYANEEYMDIEYGYGIVHFDTAYEELLIRKQKKNEAIVQPSQVPSVLPSELPSQQPSAMPSVTPTAVPSETPTQTPSVEPHIHKYSTRVKRVSATCTTGGYDIFRCSCGLERKVWVSNKKGHDYKKTVIAPTYDHVGYTKHICSRCKKCYISNQKPKLVLKKPNQVKNVSLNRKGSDLVVRFSRIKGCSGYEICYSTSKDFPSRDTKKLKLKGDSKTKKTIKGIVKNKTYYVKVRAYNSAKINGKIRTKYGSYSKTIKIR